MNFTDEQIEQAKAATRYSNDVGKQHFTPNHQHPDCIRIAAEWLDAQRRVKTPSVGRRGWHLKHICEAWGNRYVSMNDVEVAATLLGLGGRYPYYTISPKLTRPHPSRLEGIGEAGKHPNYGESVYYANCYRYEEKPPYPPDIEHRIAKLEQTIVTLKLQIDEIEESFRWTSYGLEERGIVF